MTEPLETERLVLRRWQEVDREPFRRMNADPRVMEFFPETLVAEATDKMIERVLWHFEAHDFGLFTAELKANGEFIGFIGLQHVPFDAAFTPAVEIGWRLAFEHWNRGYATEGANAVLRLAFEVLGLPEVVSMTYAGNHRSRRVMEKIGMTHDAQENFDHPHPSLRDSHLRSHVLYRKRSHARSLGKPPSRGRCKQSP